MLSLGIPSFVTKRKVMSSVQRCFTSTVTVQTIRDTRDPQEPTNFAQRLSSENSQPMDY